jgi:hypothetical protein
VTITEIPWWAETDRAKLLEQCREICKEQGILAITGDGLAGGTQAAWLAERELLQAGFAVVSLAMRSKKSNHVRYLLTELAAGSEKLQPAIPGAFSITVTASSYSEESLFEAAADELSRIQRAGGKAFAVILSGLEEDEPPAASLAVIRRLADRAGGPWILIGSETVRWNIVQPRYDHTLHPFVRDDVSQVLRRATLRSIVTADGADSLLESLFSGRPDGVRAQVAYSAMKNAEVS